MTGVVIAAAAAASAEAAPSLAPRTAQQLLTEVAQGTSKPLGPLTATVQESSDLGLPSLPSSLPSAGGTSGLTGGTQSVTIWYRDARHIRVAEAVQDGESDLRLDGRTLWTWNSKTQTATRYALPAHITGLPSGIAGGPAASSGARRKPVPDTPQAAAAQVLTAVGPTTVVSVQRNVYVAGRAAYQLSLVPRSSKSLVGSVLIAIDASRRIPLRVEVYSRGSSALAYSIGFTALSFGPPAASNFSFTPPPGATVKKQTVPGNVQSALKQAGLSQAALGGLGLGGLPALSGTAAGVPAGATAPLVSAGSLPAMPKNVAKQIRAQMLKSLPASMPKAERARLIRQFDRQMAAAQKAGHKGNVAASGALKSALHAESAARAGAPRVLGTGWLSVVATPASPQVASAVRQAMSKQPLGTATHSSLSSSAAYSSTVSVTPAAGPNLAMLRELLLATRAVHGKWGSGRLLQTTLLTVLVTSKGQILAGAVTPAVLYADVAADAG